MKAVIWHNPRCSKSREGLRLLQEKGVEVEIRKYIEDPPSVEELKEVLARTGLSAHELIRRKEKEYRELGLGAEGVGEEQLLEAMSTHPRLIERPVLVTGDSAALGRPPEQLLEIVG